jgi:hypothetical protein
MGPEKQGGADYYVWRVPGKPVAVHLHFDALEGILNEAMRGFGAVPKRGAEVGGLLLGTIEHGSVPVVRVEDFEAVECEYQRGPSYLLGERAGAEFREACRRWQPDESRPVYAVGFFRSHTREGMSLGPEDLDLLDEYFPSPAHVALLVKPHGTKVSTAGFFFREDGAFQESTPLEFPFRRRELTVEDAEPARKPMPESRLEATRPRAVARHEPLDEDRVGELLRHPGPAYAVTLPSKSRMRSGIWIPLSFVFLLFGVAIGLMIALGRTTDSSQNAPDFSLGLSILKTDGNLSLKWNRDAPAIHGADRGVLEIEDGSYSKSVDMDAAQLSNGSILYRNSSNSVRFRLVVYPRARVSVAETLQWKQ